MEAFLPILVIVAVITAVYVVIRSRSGGSTGSGGTREPNPYEQEK